jgi:hypothetical protein
MTSTTVPHEDRCPTRFERSTAGRRYVNARWQCPRKKLRGLPYCGYCEPWDKKRDRLAARKMERDGA